MSDEQQTRQEQGQEFDAFDPLETDAGLAAAEDTDLSDPPEHRGTEMGFFDHLDELRSRIIRSLLSVVATSILCGVFLDRLVEDVLLGPGKRLKPPMLLQNLQPMGQITLAMQVVLFSGIILAIPFILWQFWQFVKPGLYDKERKMAWWVSVATIFCFLAGVAFAYFVMIPSALTVMVNFEFAGIKNNIASGEYFSFILGMILATGMIFEMPILSYGLSRFGVITPAFLAKYRRHAIIILLVVAAIVTPTPDPINQAILAVPLYGLYEISILVSKFAVRQRILKFARTE